VLGIIFDKDNINILKKAKTNTEILLKELLSIHVPKEYLEFFELETVLNKADCWELVLIERENLIPESLQKEEAVLDGFCNSISVLTQSFSMKKIFLVIKRRRWKAKGSDIHYSNSYELHEKGIKMTKDFAAFLKAIN
jgi:hypothetical protein